jgi:histidyl-tRNA synthetase
VRERLASWSRGAAGGAGGGGPGDLVGALPGGEVEFAPVMARGLSYYTGPVFEVVHEGLDTTIAGGGRYDGLIGMFQNQDVPATGGSLGIERILLLLAQQAEELAGGVEVLVTIMDDDGAADAMRLAGSLRGAGFTTEVFAGGGKLGKQLRYADRRGAAIAVIRGADERAAGTVALKQLASGEQTTVAEGELVDHVARLLRA